MTLLKDLISIPERVNQGDFVLSLTAGLQDAEGTVAQYVATPQLVEAFQDALGFIRSALDDNKSKAAYLHGSFGSGKSHFMAILSLLLSGHAAAKEKKELLPLVDKHRWVEKKKLLLVPYHLIGARSLEEAIFHGYAKHVGRLHPDAPYPAVFLADPILADAGNHRKQMGDAKFFAMLNARTAKAGWGSLPSAQGWDASTFEAALRLPPLHPDKLRLVGDVVERVFPASKGAASVVSLDSGLAILTQHAKDLGYDGLVLFLDELILWLMTRAGDVAFVHAEGSKLGKLVEAQEAHRPIPLISFVARQRNPKDAIGKHVPGSDQLNFADTLQWWEGRFHTIRLDDRNLPIIVRERLLKPKSDEASRQIDAAFDRTTQVQPQVLNSLLTKDGDRQQFRDLYPFSPALIQVLVAASGLLQRERTALRVLLQLLVRYRETLSLGEIVPVGDLWDVLVEGGEALTESPLRPQFAVAEKLYRTKLRIALLDDLKIPHDWEGPGSPGVPLSAEKLREFRAYDRAAKTLLLAALFPEVEALRGLDLRRLVALNHGTIQSPIAGAEPQMLLAHLKQWAASAAELRISGEPGNPTVSVQLTGIDVDSILERANAEDTTGNRKRLIRDQLFEALGIPVEDSLFTHHAVMWRNVEHEIEVLYLNVREASDESLRTSSDRWRIVVDYPFDDPGFSPKDDRDKVHRFREKNPSGAMTIVWLPEFFTESTLADLGRLVRANHVLSGDRFARYANHLSPKEQIDARLLVENQQASLRAKILTAMEAAYGLRGVEPGTIESTGLSFADHFMSLLDGFTVQPPGAPTLGDGLNGLIAQALEHQNPGHPHFEREVTPSALKRVYEYASRAVTAKDGRVEVEKAHRADLAGIAQPLELGRMGETHFALGRHWVERFHRQMAATGTTTLTVRALMEWMDIPQRTGLRDKVKHLVIKLFADQTDRALYVHGGPANAAWDQLDPSMDLRELPLPAPEVWDEAVRRAGGVFGLPPLTTRSAASTTQLGSQIRQQASSGSAVRRLVELLEEAHARVTAEAKSSRRVLAAREAAGLLEAVERAAVGSEIETLAGAPLSVELTHVARTIKSAGEVRQGLETLEWDRLREAGQWQGEFGRRAAQLLERVREILTANEIQQPLLQGMTTIQRDLERLITEERTVRERELRTREEEMSRKQQEVEKGSSKRVACEKVDDVFGEIRKEAQANRGKEIDITWRIVEPDRNKPKGGK